MKLRRLTSALATAGLVLGISLFGSATATAQEAPVAYVALGDSYASGVGAGNYGNSGSCKRSSRAYPELWANANSPASFHFTACSGARTTDVLSGQMGPLNAGTTLVTISIGGNDAGFADTMTTCVLQSTNSCLSRVAQARQYIENQLPSRLDTVYSAIRAQAPNAHVVVLGYPQMYQLGSCWVGIGDTSRAAINAASDDLSTVTAKRAADHGFTYGDVRPAFSGHEICSSNSWLHSLTWPIGDSYHPTAAGQSNGYYPVMRNLA
ncbi:SGNH/GDSL hydrolase family protein [Streptomyces sp. ACA25]|uniref:SGNH/GDSL hydrolase family protein n=1 Tax=Streptomyces sp. ACA25 TaxID=3022596 RepID=UPI0023079003|nr:SGNH/GDSL hydrolase family protein [Streptomyces sp. ACA25]MDB1090109.1 SGNH/GDSL hydrolase family protein [Streptomyces sp. ACA25]